VNIVWKDLLEIALSVIGALSIGLASIVWWLLRALRADVARCATRESLDRLELRLSKQIGDVVFTVDRHEEINTARWVNRRDAP
jgi:hypothetical protein